MTKLKTTKAWVVFLDIYGFSSMINNSGKNKREKSLSKIHSNLLKCYNEINHYLSEIELEIKAYYFSDSTFLVCPVKSDAEKGRALRACVNCSKNIMGYFVKNDFPVRGGMAYGDTSYSDNLVIGDAIVKAHDYEKLAPAPLLILPYREFEDVNFATENTELGNIIELKNGTPIFGRLFHPFPVEIFAEMVEKYFQHSLVYGPEGPAKAWLAAKKYMDKVTTLPKFD